MGLFDPCNIGTLELKNRFVRSATGDGTADDAGAVTDNTVAMSEELGRGGVGLIVTGAAFASPDQTVPGVLRVHDDGMIPDLRRLVQAAHDGGAKIAMQIVHLGIKSWMPEGVPAPAVSQIEGAPELHKEMTGDEIDSVVSDFAAAAVRAKEAGFDAVQFHGAHGYLMSQFLSPLTNHRTDEWGGSAAKRGRFHLELTERTRAAVGRDYPLMIKLGVQDDADGGLSLDEGVETAQQLVDRGMDAIEISGGHGSASTPVRKKNGPEQAYFRVRVAAVKRAVDVPVMAVGGIRSLEMATDIVESGDADFVSMCRPFIREPDLVARWEGGDRSPARCISCNRCQSALFASMGSREPRTPLACQVEPRVGT